MGILNNGLLIAVTAHGLIGISLVWDKALLRRPATRDLAKYVFWVGAMSILGLLLMPFGFHVPAVGMAGLGFAAGVTHLAAIWFYYSALQRGEASQSPAIVGGFSPLATALIAIPLLDRPLGGHSISGFGLLVLGGFVMFLSEKFHWRTVLPRVLLSSVLFGLTNVLQKVVFNQTGFVTGYVFFTLGTFAGAAGLLLRPRWRARILHGSGHEQPLPPGKFWYFANRFVSGVGSFLIFFAISRANPALVDAISGVRYAIVFLAAYLITKWKPVWLHEDFRRPALIGKSAATAIIVAGLFLVGVSGEAAEAATSRRPRQAPADTVYNPYSERLRFAYSSLTRRVGSGSGRHRATAVDAQDPDPHHHRPERP